MAVMRYNIRARVRHHEGNGRETEYTFGKLRKERGVTWHDDGVQIDVWVGVQFARFPFGNHEVFVRGLPN